MKKVFFAALVCFTVFTTKAQDKWTRFAIDEKVSVLMPGTPEKNEVQQVLSYVLRTADSALYNVNVIDFSAFGMDSAMLQTMVGQSAFMEQFKAGFTMQMPNAEVVLSNMGNFFNYTTYEFIIEVPTEKGEKRRMHNFNLFVGSKDYSFTFSAQENEEALKSKFLRSIEVK